VAVAPQHIKVRTKDLAFKAIKAKDLTLKAKTRTKDQDSVLADN